MINSDTKKCIQNIKEQLDLICDDIAKIDEIVKSIDFYWQSSGGDLLKERFAEDYEEQNAKLDDIKSTVKALSKELSQFGDSKAEKSDFLPVNIFE